MDSDTIRTAVLAVLGALAVTLTAAMLPSAFQPERRGEGGTGVSSGGEGAGGPLAPSPVEPPEAVIEIPFLTELGLLLTLAMVVAVLWHLYANRRAVFQAVIVTLAVALAFYLLPQWFVADPSAGGYPSFAPWTDNASSGSASEEAVTDPPVAALVLVLLLTAAILGTALAAHRRSPEEPESASADESASTDVAAVGRAAGRAADRIEEGVDLDNEVYRAWREMTSLLDLSRPETNTAGEFEEAAVDAGMDPADVHELTTLFETVRYGGYEPEPADERRAIELLRRIEDRYTEDDS